MKIKIERDTITPFLRALEKKTKGAEIRSFLGSQYPILTRNISECFRTKTYRSESGVKNWAPLKPATMKRRVRAGTWRGEHDSILFETGRMWYGSWASKRVSARNKVYSLSLSPSPSERQKFMKHQYTGVGKVPTIRPPYSILPATEELLIRKTERYFLG